MDVTQINVGIDLKKFLRELPRFFEKSDAFVSELMQNAYRAGATEVHITAGGGTIKFEDNGVGIKDPSALVEVARSDWNNFVVAEQDPAGMGLFSAIFSSEAVEIESSCDGKRGFSLSISKSDVQDMKPVEVRWIPINKKGTSITLRRISCLKKENLGELVKEKIEYYVENIHGTPMTIRLNGKRLPQKDFFEAITGNGKTYTKEITAGTLMLFDMPHYLHSQKGNVLFHGHALHMSYNDAITRFALKIKGLGLTPRLPDRTAFVEDEKFALFEKELGESIVEALESEALSVTSFLAERYLGDRLHKLVPAVVNFDIADYDVPMSSRPFSGKIPGDIYFVGNKPWDGEKYDFIIEDSEIDYDNSILLAALYYLRNAGVKVGFSSSRACGVCKAPVFAEKYRKMEDFAVSVKKRGKPFNFGCHKIVTADIVLKDKATGRAWKVDGVLPEGDIYGSATYYWSLPFSPAESFDNTSAELGCASNLVCNISDEDNRDDPYGEDFESNVAVPLRITMDTQNTLIENVTRTVNEVINGKFGYDVMDDIELSISGGAISLAAYGGKKVYRYVAGEWAVKRRKAKKT